ncbi:MAG TPA: glycogen debranching enzyme GlgX [Cytophagales bacterium]|jgi:isoamylase|nr:glycogen debranching enzyme GlgX [Cytophagales bacterium]
MINYINIPHGHAFPLGATYYPEGVNFSLFSKNAEHVELWLFDRPEDAIPSRVIKLESDLNRTFYYWHAFVNDIKPGQLYGYKIHGPYDPKNGHLFDGDKLLIDPYARALANGKNYDREAAKKPGDNSAVAFKSVVVDPYDYNWEDDEPIQRPYSTSVIYEMHVRGFTKHESAGLDENIRGTYKGVIEKIPYLKSLGITAVELMPVQQFDIYDAVRPLTNYWGYSPIAFFAPHHAYASVDNPLEVVREFKDMIKAFHKAGIEVILDVVFNHTAEADENGPVLSFKGIENKAYYILDQKTSKYKNYSGCGNTLNANHSIVRRMIGDCLRSWVTEYHIDGFRFDLASVLSRDENGHPLENPPVLWEIESDPVLAGAKIIAEAWDAAGLYQVGTFIGDKWAEWNGKYRDHVRKFLKGDEGQISKLASRIMGSPDIYKQPDRETTRSIHFVTCHDGFTLNDLVSYNQKHNYANGESNRDGANDNYSWNHGVEGPTNNSKVNILRLRQIKNFLTITFFSQGTPMLLMGDEVRRTQKGNNNAYCQDNELSWFDWSLIKKNEGLLEFTRSIIGFTQSLKIFEIEELLLSQQHIAKPHIAWHGIKLNAPDWGGKSHSLAFTLSHPEADETLQLMVNAYWEKLRFELPVLKNGKKWHQIINTFQAHPHDFNLPHHAPQVGNGSIDVMERSVIVVMAL